MRQQRVIVALSLLSIVLATEYFSETGESAYQAQLAKSSENARLAAEANLRSLREKLSLESKAREVADASKITTEVELHRYRHIAAQQLAARHFAQVRTSEAQQQLAALKASLDVEGRMRRNVELTLRDRDDRLKVVVEKLNSEQRSRAAVELARREAEDNLVAARLIVQQKNLTLKDMQNTLSQSANQVRLEMNSLAEERSARRSAEAVAQHAQREAYSTFKKLVMANAQVDEIKGLLRVAEEHAKAVHEQAALDAMIKTNPSPKHPDGDAAFSEPQNNDKPVVLLTSNNSDDVK